MATTEQATHEFLAAKFDGRSRCRFSLQSPAKVPALDLGNGNLVSGVCSIAKHLQRTESDFKDVSLEDRMDVEQWIEYATTTVKCTDSESLKSILKNLNGWLKARTYFVANMLTMADIIMFYSLYPLFAELSFQEKEVYIHVSRWFQNVQKEKKVQQSLQHLSFLRTPVYDGVRAH